jgi:hypothetical protein
MHNCKIWRAGYDIIPAVALDDPLEYRDRVAEAWNHALEHGALSSSFQPQIIISAVPRKVRWPAHLEGHSTLTILGTTGEDLGKLSAILEAEEEAEPGGDYECPIVTLGIPTNRLEAIRKIVRRRHIVHITVEDFCDGSSDITFLAAMSAAGGMAATENCTDIIPGPAFEQKTRTTRQANGKAARKRLFAYVLTPVLTTDKKQVTIHASSETTTIINYSHTPSALQKQSTKYSNSLLTRELCRHKPKHRPGA